MSDEERARALFEQLEPTRTRPSAPPRPAQGATGLEQGEHLSRREEDTITIGPDEVEGLVMQAFAARRAALEEAARMTEGHHLGGVGMARAIRALAQEQKP